MTEIDLPRTKGFNLRVRRWIEKQYDGNVWEASQALSIPNTTLWQIVTGKTKTPSASVLVKLSSAMGCSIDFLITGER
jgi:plasmid maintenance system antidote protein VapI